MELQLANMMFGYLQIAIPASVLILLIWFIDLKVLKTAAIPKSWVMSALLLAGVFSFWNAFNSYGPVVKADQSGYSGVYVPQNNHVSDPNATLVDKQPSRMGSFTDRWEAEKETFDNE